MEDPDLPASPRKKPKLEDLSYVAKQAGPVTEMPTSPEVVPHHHSATTENQHSKPATMSCSTDIPSCSRAPTTTATASMTPIASPDSKMNDPRYHLEASKVFYRKLAENASKSESNTAGDVNALDDIGGKEAACGITEFVSPDLLGFSGILRKRYAFRIVFIPL